jgi:hypothetical protein
MRLSILLAAAAAAERVDRDADGVPDAAPEGACCECCYGCNPVWKSKFYGAFVLNRRVVLHAIDATPARWRGGACSSPLDGASTAAPDALVDFHTGATSQPIYAATARARPSRILRRTAAARGFICATRSSRGPVFLTPSSTPYHSSARASARTRRPGGGTGSAAPII